MRHVLPLSFLVVALAVLSLHLGLRPTGPATVWRALWGEGQDPAALIVRGLRLPRMALALGVGAALGVLMGQTQHRFVVFMIEGCLPIGRRGDQQILGVG
ncbi:MAG: iron chelate uptake ABC transporter family permease subunit [Bacteroidetes bacterium]|nr:iron chelate uptake ABC transporter family permease subunit [Bacteroidota bacterium]